MGKRTAVRNRRQEQRPDEVSVDPLNRKRTVQHSWWLKLIAACAAVVVSVWTYTKVDGKQSDTEIVCKSRIVHATRAAVDDDMLLQEPARVLQLLSSARSCAKDHAIEFDIADLPKPQDFPQLGITALLLFHSFGAGSVAAGYRYSKHQRHDIYMNDLKQVWSWCRDYAEFARDAGANKSFKYYASCCEAQARLAPDSLDFYQCVQEAVDAGLWPSFKQRPFPYYVPGLEARPIWSPGDVSPEEIKVAISAQLHAVQQQYGMILHELDGVPDSHWRVDATLGLFDKGSWAELYLFPLDELSGPTCVVMPKTCKMLNQYVVEDVYKIGQPGHNGFFLNVKIGKMFSGTHASPHFGSNSARLRSHLGLQIPQNEDGSTCCTLRVDTQHITWKEGSWNVFDDTFEHEVWNNCTSSSTYNGTRIILMADLPHPGLFQYD